MTNSNLRVRAVMATNRAQSGQLNILFKKPRFYLYKSELWKDPIWQYGSDPVTGEGVWVTNRTSFPTVKMDALSTGYEAIRH